MNLPELPRNASRQEMRKALIRMRLELHRQELRHETNLVLRPIRQAKGMALALPQSLGLKHAPLWGVAAATAAGFFAARSGGLQSWITHASRYLPFITRYLNNRKP
ncbi:hypothetical protein [Pseudomonas sp. LRF_L74]|uniref:hypothetical protein n=1 Tax=Pseudomonas sp. LRF_L74 TaxID=3369422 RepID=UPI003F614498